MLYKVTGFDAVSFQPNSGAQGEYAGLLSIREYHKANNSQRNICLIPESAHGTNPASAIMAGLKVVIVKCDENGNIDFTDLTNKVSEAGDKLSSLMVTYPSTHGVFEHNVNLEQMSCTSIFIKHFVFRMEAEVLGWVQYALMRNLNLTYRNINLLTTHLPTRSY